jgi:hypothetical protein
MCLLVGIRKMLHSAEARKCRALLCCLRDVLVASAAMQLQLQQL